MESSQDPPQENVIDQEVVLTGVTPKEEGVSTDPESTSVVENGVKSEEPDETDVTKDPDSAQSDEESTTGKEEKCEKGSRKKRIAVFVIVLVVFLLLLSLVIALALIILQRDECQERERERNRIHQGILIVFFFTFVL